MSVEHFSPPRRRDGPIVHLITTNAYAGLERHVLQLLREMRGLQVDVLLICPPSATRLRREAHIASVPVLSIRGWNKGIFWWRGVMRALGANPPAVLHVHDGRAALAGAFLARRLSNTIVVRTQHFTRPASIVRGGKLGLASVAAQRQVNRSLHGYIAVSPAVATAAHDRAETAASEVVVIPPGVELPGPEEVEAAADRRARHTGILGAYVGRLEDEKELEVLVAAIPQVLSRVPDVRFVLAGAGAAEPRLRDLVDLLGVSEAVDWLGWIPASGEVLGRCHIYINTWPHEGFGMAMAEAMAHGVPVIATASGASADLVESGVTGLLVAPGSPDELSRAIVRLAEDTDLRDEMGASARDRAHMAYGVRRTATMTLAFYERLAATCPLQDGPTH